jgi:hypothetical protein
MRTSQLAEKKQTLAGMHRYQRNLLVVLAGRSLVRSGLPGRRMIGESTGGLSRYPTIPDRPGIPHDHLEGAGLPTAIRAIGKFPVQRWGAPTINNPSQRDGTKETES